MDVKLPEDMILLLEYLMLFLQIPLSMALLVEPEDFVMVMHRYCLVQIIDLCVLTSIRDTGA